MDKIRCPWCNMKNPLYIDYHDNEWGVFRNDDEYLFEMLILEGFQAGLSWECILNKREHFREVFDGFDVDKVAAYDDKKVEKLLADRGIVRNRRKVTASIRNACIFKEITEQYGSFWNYLNTFISDRHYVECNVTNELSDAISKDLVKRGMRFAGSTIIYSYLQAIGVINSHTENCFMFPGRNQ